MSPVAGLLPDILRGFRDLLAAADPRVRLRAVVEAARFYSAHVRHGLIPAPPDPDEIDGLVGAALAAFGDAADAVGGPLDGEEEDRGEEDAEGGDADHAGEHRRAQQPPHLRPRPLRRQQRHHPEDERHAGHDDRPQPQPARFEDRVVSGRPGRPAGAGDDDPPAEVGALFRRGLELVKGEFEPRTWQMFWDHTVAGQAVADVAAAHGVSPAAVRQAKYRVLTRLRAEFGGLVE